MSNRAIRNLLFGSSLAVIGAVTPANAQDTSDDIVVTARRVEERLQDVPISIAVYNEEQIQNANITNSVDLATIDPSLSAGARTFGDDNVGFSLRAFTQDIGTQPSVGVYFNDVVAPRGFSNGVVSGDGAGPGSFFDLQNVQVLKGPQGTLFGRNTTGGAILLVPRRPSDEFEGYLQAGVGNYDLQRLQGVVNIPLGDQAALRIGIDDQSREGWLENNSGIGPDNFNDVNYTSYRAGFRVNLTPSLENYTLFSYTDSDTNGSVAKMTERTTGLFPRFLRLGPLASQQLATQGDGFYDFAQDIENPGSHLVTWQLINTTTVDLSDNLTFKNIVSYGEMTQELTSDIFGTNLYTNPDANLTTNDGDPVSFSITSPVNHTSAQGTFTEEARLEGNNLDGRLTWQSGVYFERSTPRGLVGSFSPVLAHCDSLGSISVSSFLNDPSDSASLLNALNDCSSVIPISGNADGQGIVNYTTGETTSQTAGVYLQGSYDLTEQLSLTLGYRYTWDRIKNQAQQMLFFLDSDGGLFDPPPNYYPVGASIGVDYGPFTCSNPLATANCVSTYSVQTEAPTWLIGLDYTPTDDLLLYGKYTRGYRSGTISPNVVDPVVSGEVLRGRLTTAAGEQVDSYEIGAKWTFGDRDGISGYLNGALFYNDFTNQQLQVGFVRLDIPAAPTAAPLNSGASMIQGVELQGAIRPFDGLTLSFDYTHLDTEVKQAVGAVDFDGDGTIDDIVGPYQVVPGASPSVGGDLPNSPPNRYSVGAQYELPLSESIGAVTLGAQWFHTDEAPGSTIVPGYETLNVNVSWDSVFGGPVDLNLFGTNVTDEEYYVAIGAIGQVTGFNTASLGPPAIYGISATYRFN